MAVLKFTTFGGEFPSTLPRNLSPEDAQMAQNLQAQTAEFRPVAGNAFVASATQVRPGFPTVVLNHPKSIYRAVRNADGSLNLSPSTGWRAVQEQFKIAKSPLDDNLTDRNYATSEDGSSPPVAFDARGQLRNLGVPAPLTKPNCTVEEGYTFTPEQRVFEVSAALDRLTNSILTTALTASDAGFSPTPTDGGWIRVSAMQAPSEAPNVTHVWRLFGVDPATKRIIHTYSAMPPDQAAWVLDPSLGGEYVTNRSGRPMPAWAGQDTAWWGIKFRARYDHYNIDRAKAIAAMLALDTPGTQGATKWLVASEANTLTDKLQAKFDKDEPTIKAFVATLLDAQKTVGNIFNQGGAVSVTASIADFYARQDVQTAISNAKVAYAEILWSMAERIGSATAPDTGGAGSAGGD